MDFHVYTPGNLLTVNSYFHNLLCCHVALSVVRSIGSRLFDRLGPGSIPAQPLIALLGHLNLWSVNADLPTNETNHTRRKQETALGTRAVVGADHTGRQRGLRCFSCSGTFCSHRSRACAVLNLTAEELKDEWSTKTVVLFFRSHLHHQSLFLYVF